ncbi:MAG: hypothetical protein LKG97_09730 [Acetobacter peroxydans]|jgi:hypothetical protein|uniref:hypothetical protein n=1 Tax=Acetobacter peroxydans TaxID=104098 RepID=UPI002353E9A9|nr:hypothetical protein [Acetobacter peroxydans]MCI1411973.1 hypothetical protein [Acetobacter peroxydans]
MTIMGEAEGLLSEHNYRHTDIFEAERSQRFRNLISAGLLAKLFSDWVLILLGG